MSFEKKYLKYKNKYLDLKNQLFQEGGASFTGRITRDIKKIHEDSDRHGIMIMDGDSPNKFTAFIMGPLDSPYANRQLEFSIELPERYPMEAPKIKAISRIYHPNIISTRDPDITQQQAATMGTDLGTICLNIFKGEWSPALSLLSSLISIQQLLADPNPDDPLEPEIAELYVNNRAEYNRRAIAFI
jgi:ubiquitin-protein ligase